MNLFLAALGLRCCTRAFSSCGARAQLLHGVWDFSGPGLEPMSPALAGGFLTTAPPGKSAMKVFITYLYPSHPRTSHSVRSRWDVGALFCISIYRLFSCVVKIENHLHEQIKDTKLNRIIRIRGSDDSRLESKQRLVQSDSFQLGSSPLKQQPQRKFFCKNTNLKELMRN